MTYYLGTLMVRAITDRLMKSYLIHLIIAHYTIILGPHINGAMIYYLGTIVSRATQVDQMICYHIYFIILPYLDFIWTMQ